MISDENCIGKGEPGMHINSVLQARILRLNGLHQSITLEYNHVHDLIRLRTTATRLIANGDGKAFVIVRAIDARLEKVLVGSNSLFSISGE